MIQLLVVDDDDINLFLLNHLLKKSNFNLETITFTNPEEALQHIKNCIAENKMIDLILLDINMPQMTGWDILDELRIDGMSTINGSLVYMLSSSVHSTDNEKAAQYPEVAGFISKPITQEFLSELFSEILEAKLE